MKLQNRWCPLSKLMLTLSFLLLLTSHSVNGNGKMAQAVRQ